MLNPTKKDTPHPRAKDKPRKRIGGAKSCLESNPIPTRDAQRVQINLVHTRTQRPMETETGLCLSVSCGGMGQQWPATGALGAADPGMA